MIELVDAAIGAAGAGVVAAVAGFIRSRAGKARRDERAELIALGASYGVEHVPGENTDSFRARVINERDERIKVERQRWIEAERDREDERRRKAFEKGRFL
jgi:hypothetical protein